jgi:hypothetical protein
MTEKEVILAEVNDRIEQVSQNIDAGLHYDTLACSNIKLATLQGIRDFITSLPPSTSEAADCAMAVLIGMMAGVAIGLIF